VIIPIVLDLFSSCTIWKS